jgi:ferredoxin
MRLTLHVWRQDGRTTRAASRRTRRGRVGAHVLPGDARRRQRALTRRRGPDRVRSRLPRGHLRLLRLHDQRRAARAAAPRPPSASSTCALSDGDELWIEPWRATAFPVLRTSSSTGPPSTASSRQAATSPCDRQRARRQRHPSSPRTMLDLAMDAAECIGCGACVAACPNASAMLFTGGQGGAPRLLPQGQPERYSASWRWCRHDDDEGFGHCTNHGACQTACPKGISVDYIARLNRRPAEGRGCAGRETARRLAAPRSSATRHGVRPGSHARQRHAALVLVLAALRVRHSGTSSPWKKSSCASPSFE